MEPTKHFQNLFYRIVNLKKFQVIQIQGDFKIVKINFVSNFEFFKKIILTNLKSLQNKSKLLEVLALC